jgi:hypothetical protein
MFGARADLSLPITHQAEQVLPAPKVEKAPMPAPEPKPGPADAKPMGKK